MKPRSYTSLSKKKSSFQEARAKVWLASGKQLCDAACMSVLNDLYLSRKPIKSFVLMGVTWASFAAMMPDLKAQVGASDAELGLAYMLGNLMAFTTAWAAPRFDDRFGRFSLVLAGTGMALAFVMIGASGSVLAFGLGMACAALMSGIADILMNARVGELEASSGRPLLTLNHAIYSFAFAGTAALTGVLREVGFALAEVALMVLGLALLLAPGSVIGGPEHRADDTPSAGWAGRLVVWLIGLTVLASFIAEHTIEAWSALHLERTLNSSAAFGSLGPALGALAMGVGRLFGQMMRRHVRDVPLLAGACITAAMGIGLLALAPTVTLAYVGLLVMGLGISLVYPLAISLVGRSVPEAERVKAIGQASVIGYTAFFLGPVFVGGSSEMFGLRMAFLQVGAILVFVALVIVPMIARRAPD